MKMIAGAALIALIATSCGSGAGSEPASTTQPTSVQCSGSDSAAGLALSIDWAPEESREFSRSNTNAGAGVPPDIDGITFTSQLTIEAVAVDTNGTLLNVRVAGGGTDGPELNGLPGVEADFRIDSMGQVIDVVDDPLLAELARDLETYHFVTAIGDGETTSALSSMLNPLTASVEDATLTVEHLGTDDQGCEVVRATRHLGPDAVIDDLDNLLDELDDPNERPNAFADIGFEGAVVQSTTYRFDHGIDRLRLVEFTEAWGIFGAGGIDTRVETRTLIDITDQ